MLAMRRRSVRLTWAFVVSAAMCAGCGRNHTQREGTYEFVAQEILRDDCAIQAATAQLFSGRMRIFGDQIRMQMDERIFSMEAVGFFLNSVERFTLDGSAGNVTVQVRGAECLDSIVQAHIDSTTDSATAFHGATQVRFKSDQSGCSCQLWARFTAQLQ
jgi:hypothetical protein